MKKIVIIGITGRVGSRLANELLDRGHHVTGIARKVDHVEPRDNLTPAPADASSPDALVPLLRDHDALISATSFVGGANAASLISAAKQAGVPRLLVVGGSANLEVSPGQVQSDAPGFPEEYRAEANASRQVLNGLRQEQALDWAFFSPSNDFEPGRRTGKFRLGGDALIRDANGNSAISMEDYAVAMADEVESPKHSRQQFTAGY